MNYLDTVDKRIKEYYKILEKEFPAWLLEYINTKELLQQQYISVTCGTIYTDLFDSNFFFSSLDHSIATALIVWHFTHDKKQTLAGLFHDIATPVFKHCIDFLNGDYMTQESTEDLTKEIILNSKEIMDLLEKDNILIDEIDDYHIYPIADNDTPQLSSDRLEYSLSNALFTYNLLSIEDIKKIYDDITITTNEKGIEELGFKTKIIARKFVEVTSKLSIIYREDRTRYSMQFLADIMKRLQQENKITVKELYEKKEQDIIEIIEKSNYSNIYNIWKKTKKVKVSTEEPNNTYYVCHGAKIRYINPLVNDKRISDIDKVSQNYINNNLKYDMTNYVYIDNIKL